MKLKEFLNKSYKKGEWVLVPDKNKKGRIVEVFNTKLKIKFLYDKNIYTYSIKDIKYEE